MSNLKDWISECFGDEEIEAVIVGKMGWGDCGSDGNPKYNDIPFGKVLSYAEALPLIDYEFSCGYGAPECNAVYVYSKTKIMAISQYDGSTSWFSIPRNPTDGIPEMPGG